MVYEMYKTDYLSHSLILSLLLGRWNNVESQLEDSRLLNTFRYRDSSCYAFIHPKLIIAQGNMSFFLKNCLCNMSFKWRPHHYRCRALKFGFCSLLMIFEQEGTLWCYTCCDMGSRVLWSHSKDSPLN